MLPQSSDSRMICNDKVVGDRWYVAHTQPRAESRAVTHLEWQGYSVFCPRYRKTVRHARKAKQVLAPLFPNYLFLRLDASRYLWRAVNGTRGVVRLISQGETPAPLPRGIVEALLAKTNAGVVDWTPAFKIGQAVRIADGPFADLVGKLEHLDAAGRVRVLLDLLGRHVSVALRCESLTTAA
jgi:transcription elongation factor/antiterminator RfaH